MPACTSTTPSTERSSSPTRIEIERSGHFSAGEEVVFSFIFDNILSPGRYTPVFEVANGSGLNVIDRFEGGFSFVVTGHRPWAAWSTCRSAPRASRRQLRSQAIAVIRRQPMPERRRLPVRTAGAADPRSARADRRLAAILAPDVQHRGDAVEGALLRLGARLSVAAGQAAAAVRRALRLLHQDRPRRLGEGSELPVLRRPAPGVDRVVHLLQ